MHNDRTPNFDLPLPHAENDLSDDVGRLREALQKTDAALNAAGDKATWAGLTGRPATFPPATHQHPWSDVTSKPATYPPATHTHLWADTTNKPTAFPPAAHTHEMSELHLETAKTDKAGIVKPDDNTIKVAPDGTISVNADKLTARYA